MPDLWDHQEARRGRPVKGVRPPGPCEHQRAHRDLLTEIYERAWDAPETIGNGDINNGSSGISHAASEAYGKISTIRGLLRPDTSATLPLQFAEAEDKAQYFLKLMRALLLGRVIAKAPLKNASDIRALHAAKVKFEAKGYDDGELIQLLVVAHRLWTPRRMDQFSSSVKIPTVSTAAPAAPAAAPAAAAADGDDGDMAGFETRDPRSQRTPAAAAVTAPTAAPATTATGAAAAATGVALANSGSSHYLLKSGDGCKHGGNSDYEDSDDNDDDDDDDDEAKREDNP